jgi:hypothetical protein
MKFKRQIRRKRSPGKVAVARPVLPFMAREYALHEPEKLDVNFQPPLDEDWGLLHTVDAADRRFTLLGDYGFVLAMRSASEDTGIRPPDYYDPRMSTRTVDHQTQQDEFPFEEFRAAYAVAGWPDDWQEFVKRHGALMVIRLPGVE